MWSLLELLAARSGQGLGFWVTRGQAWSWPLFSHSQMGFVSSLVSWCSEGVMSVPVEVGQH